MSPPVESTSGHNSKARAGVIRDIINQRREVEGRIAELMAERKKIQGRIKSDLGLKVADFNALYRIADLESDDRDQFLDTLREGFAALGIGGQSSFLAAIAPDEAEKPAKGKLPTVEECETLGGISFRTGEAVDTFPETIATKARKEAFIHGWESAKLAKAAEAQMADAEEFGEGDQPGDEVDTDTSLVAT